MKLHSKYKNMLGFNAKTTTFYSAFVNAADFWSFTKNSHVPFAQHSKPAHKTPQTALS